LIVAFLAVAQVIQVSTAILPSIHPQYEAG